MARRSSPEESRRRAREEALELMAHRPVAQHLRGTGAMSAEPATSVRGGSPETGEWHQTPAAHRPDSGEQVQPDLSRRGLTPADRDRLLAEQRQLRSLLTAARRHAATRPVQLERTPPPQSSPVIALAWAAA
jgi:hypothetical protein